MNDRRDEVPTDRSAAAWRACLRALALGSLALLPLSSVAGAECDRIPRCELVWADEFDGSSVDAGKWAFQRGDGSEVGLPPGWGNNELQWYQRENATVADGFLTITARQESVSGLQYTSARMRTLGLADWQYGRVEMLARMPLGRGLWPAFWLLSSEEAYGGWAASGEIDVVEYVGSEPDRVLGTLHYGGPWPDNASSGNDYELESGTFADDFHVFAVEWERGEIRWYVDEAHYATQTEWFSTGGPYPAPFDRRFHLLLNVAVGGNLPGSPDASTTFPQEMVVDYVRVYQAAAAKGTQASAASLLYDQPEKMKKIDAGLWMPFANQARKSDRTSDGRSLSCALRARSTKKALAVKGRLRLQLRGSAGRKLWTSRTFAAPVDPSGRVSFSAELIGELVDEAAGDGASVDRFRVSFDGSGGKKVERLDVDCWQTASPSQQAVGNRR